MRRAIAPALSLLWLTGQASAAEPVAIAHGDRGLDAVVERLAVELASAGHRVRRAAPSEPSPCEVPPSTPSSPEPRGAWIFVARDPSDAETVVASICFRSAVSLLQRVASRGSFDQPERFALTTAEALNGLGAQLPLVARPAPSPGEHASPRAEAPPRTRPTTSLSLAQTGVIDVAGVPPLWGASLQAELGVAAGFALTLDAFLPVSAAELENDQVSLRARSSWLRFGPSLHAPVGQARVAGELLAGPALVWANADARAPRLGGADVAVAALFALGASCEYPRDTSVFVLGKARASLLLPAVRLALAEDRSHAFGPLLLEASLGLGVRFGD